MRAELYAATAAAALLVGAATTPAPLVAQTASETEPAPLSETQAPAETELKPLPSDEPAADEADKGAMTEEAPEATGEQAEAMTGETSEAGSGQAAAPVGAGDAGEMIVISQPENSWLTDEVVGASVMNVAGERVGEIESLVFDETGVVAAVVGVGGFLGIGEKEVGIAWTSLTPTEDGFAVTATAQQLSDAPEFATQEEIRERAEAEARRAEAERAASEAAERAAKPLTE